MSHLGPFVFSLIGLFAAYGFAKLLFPSRGRFARLKSNLMTMLFGGLGWIVMLISMVMSNGNPLPFFAAAAIIMAWFIWGARRARRKLVSLQDEAETLDQVHQRLENSGLNSRRQD